MSNAETLLRQEVAACTLILNEEGLLGYSGHVSARIPGEDAYLIQPIDVSRAGLKPDDLMVCNFDGKVIRGNNNPKARPPAEVFLHGEILRARPDVNSVAHFHHDLTNVFTLVEDAVLSPIKNHAIRWRSGILPCLASRACATSPPPWAAFSRRPSITPIRPSISARFWRCAASRVSSLEPRTGKAVLPRAGKTTPDTLEAHEGENLNHERSSSQRKLGPIEETSSPCQP